MINLPYISKNAISDNNVYLKNNTFPFKLFRCRGLNYGVFVNIPEYCYVDIVKSTICSLEKPTALIFRTNCVPRLNILYLRHGIL